MFSPTYPLVEDMSKIYARPLPRVYAIFLFAMFFLYAEICWDMLSGLSSLSLGWLLNGKQKNSIYSLQRTGIFFFFTHIFLSNLVCDPIQDHNITKYPIFGYFWWPEWWPIRWGGSSATKFYIVGGPTRSMRLFHENPFISAFCLDAMSATYCPTSGG